MHFKDGSEARVGDRCRFQTGKYDGPNWVKVMREGIIVDITPGAASCNAMVTCVYLEEKNGVRFVKTYEEHVTLGQCEKAELPV